MYRSESAINAKVIIELDPKILNSIHRAIEPETYNPSSDRSRTTINIDRDQIELNTEATDISALRANLNSYLRWVDAIHNMLSDIE